MGGLGELFGPDALGDGLHIVAVAALIVVLVVLARSWPLRYGAFAGACLVVALAGDNLNSLERYSLNGVPIFPRCGHHGRPSTPRWVGTSRLRIGVGGAVSSCMARLLRALKTRKRPRVASRRAGQLLGAAPTSRYQMFGTGGCLVQSVRLVARRLLVAPPVLDTLCRWPNRWFRPRRVGPARLRSSPNTLPGLCQGPVPPSAP
ncbi:MAG: hypothetical protein Ct9H300mP12_04740 [Acidimicrobiales bacterium]|nr:MAG: hypothetical protein Ct9H300mP12_04740 [Acidimicrobiales bacterium]